LAAFVDELADELGPVDEGEVSKYSELFAVTAASEHMAESGWSARRRPGE
jgi:hypothetical protein